ncbi:hypothetical protein CDEF62S_04359 [Castellaniella defragrans]
MTRIHLPARVAEKNDEDRRSVGTLPIRGPRARMAWASSMARIGHAGLALGALLVLGLVWPAPTQAESVPASFDCAKAARVVEKFICSHAVLRWQDLALSRSYRAARGAVAGSARDSLLAGQRDWIRDRDRRCIADRTFKELSGPSAELSDQAYGCLKVLYLDRRRMLQDLAAPPLSPKTIKAIDLGPVASARPEIVEDGGLRVPAIHLSPDGALAEILLPSLELDGPDQAWIYRVADGRLAAATPAPNLQQPHPPGAPMAIETTAWRGGTLYVRVAVWGGDGDGERVESVVYAATIEGHTLLGDVPADIRALLDPANPPNAVASDEALREQMLRDEPDHIEPVQGNRDFLVWADDPGHGTISLKMRKRVTGSPAYLVAWGSWNLSHPLLDSRRSQLVYAGDTGIMVFDGARRTERRIAGTSQGDWPYAVSENLEVLVWSTRNRCGDEFMTEQDENAPERFCVARLPTLEGSL